MKPQFDSIITVTLNPTIDRILEVPGFKIGSHLQGRQRLREPAGKAINVSRALSELGVKSTAIGWVGMNAFDLFHEAMRKVGVKACFLPITGATRENITIIDPNTHTETHIRDAGPKVDDADVRRLTDLLQNVVTAESLVIFTGSLPPGLPLHAWENLLQTCIDRGARVAVDVSGPPLRVASEKQLWMIKPNEFELGELLGTRLPHEQAVVKAGRELATRYPFVLITLGRKGAYCFAEGRTLHARAELPADRVRSTVGCGDAMLAGFLAGLLSDGTTDTALREGVAISAAAAATEEPARFERAMVAQLREAVIVRPVD
ncbi:MAG TPA: 1-phosphofructokinase family hexose kinase [Phycisphaerae bacterium]|nr:1-phosphofructokinase family hexose kinase [Phycisphaerae bacterium]HOJ75744.1 1-phosphofructokinase family hexose kinase [Phycisphaerae bacterium]HOM51410.1 1-phosphofructokinase family hexose kinase [Phycisphaerae bacterium]HON67451.1 1-phosphofructokinase family hexose kinase [Phycisphaerae bacterium]HOQ87896.1 1-phosphofructokinase family hexose kinase [Phycisphaerae bacterium]